MERKIYEVNRELSYTMQCMVHNEQIFVKCESIQQYLAIKARCRRKGKKWNCNFYVSLDGNTAKITRIEKTLKDDDVNA